MYSIFGNLPPGPDLVSHLNRIAGEVAGKFEHSEADDLAQQAWAWMGEHPAQAASWWYDGDDGTGTDTSERKFSYRNFMRDIHKVMVTYARRDRAHSIGYEPEDECYYSRRQVEQYIPFVFSTEVLATIGEVREGPGAKNDPAKGGDTMASAMDVRRAFNSVIAKGGPWHKVLFMTHALDWTQEVIGEELGVSQQRVSDLLKAATEAMAQFLNGPEIMPGLTLKAGPGTRKVRTNAEAIQAIH